MPHPMTRTRTETMLLEALEADDLVQRAGYTLAVSKVLGTDAEAAFFRGGVRGLNEWLIEKRRRAIATAKGEDQ